MEIFIAWIIGAIIIGFVGTNRRIGFAGAFFLSVLLSPLLGLLVTLFSKSKEDEERESKLLEAQGKQSAILEKMAANDKIDKLSNLAKLKESGVITDDEFAKLKSEILTVSETLPIKESAVPETIFELGDKVLIKDDQLWTYIREILPNGEYRCLDNSWNPKWETFRAGEIELVTKVGH